MVDQVINNTKKELNDNQNKINKNNAIIHELDLFDFENRIGRIALLSTLLYLPVIISLFFLNIPGVIFPLATILSSFGLGFVGNLLMEKKAKCRERFKKISKSKNESERLEEILRLEMENERLNNRNEVINRVNKKHNDEINMIKKFSKNKNFSIHMNKSNYSKNTLIKKIEEAEDDLKVKYDLLDKLSDESLIKDKKTLLSDKMTPLFKSMMSSTIPLMLSILPVFSYTIRPLPAPSMIPMVSTLGVSAITLLSSLTYFYSKEKNTKKAIKAICKENNKNENENVYMELSKLKSQMVNIIHSLNAYINELENYDLIEEYNKERLSNKNNSFELEGQSLENGAKLILK